MLYAEYVPLMQGDVPRLVSRSFASSHVPPMQGGMFPARSHWRNGRNYVPPMQGDVPYLKPSTVRDA